MAHTMVSGGQMPSQGPGRGGSPAMWAYKPLRTKYFHGASSGNQPPYLLKSRYGKVRSKHHRVRQRAHCILLSFYGKTTDDLVHSFNVTHLTIYHWFDAWETRHFAGLYDHAGRGRHPKLTREEQEKVQQYIA